jgi:hypothetical protein
MAKDPDNETRSDADADSKPPCAPCIQNKNLDPDLLAIKAYELWRRKRSPSQKPTGRKPDAS